MAEVKPSTPEELAARAVFSHDTPLDGGAWCTYIQDVGPLVHAIYPDELSAYRSVNGDGFSTVIFLPYGVTLAEAIRAERAREAMSS